MSDTPARSVERLNARIRLLRIGCLANVILFAVMIALPIAFFSRLFGTTVSEADQSAIRGVLDAQVVAWNKRDLDGFMAGYWKDDALSFISEDRVTKGWTAT